jgi:hypothetical protein
MSGERKGGRRGESVTPVPAYGVVAQLLDEAAGLRLQASQRADERTISYWSGLADGIDHALLRLGLVAE